MPGWVDKRKLLAYVSDWDRAAAYVIKTFKNKALGELWSSGKTSKIDRKMHERILRRLSQLDAAIHPDEMNLLGFDFHRLHGKPVRYSVHVNGPWCITFEFENGDAYRVDYEQYH